MSMVFSHEGGEACVCDLTPAFDLSQPTISHHLKVLHEAGLLDREKRGVWVYYKAKPEAMAAIRGCSPPARCRPPADTDRHPLPGRPPWWGPASPPPGMTCVGRCEDIGTPSHSLDMGFQAGLTDPG